MAEPPAAFPPAAASNLSGIAGAIETPAISIVLCTHNRVHHLGVALRSLFEQGETTARYEVLLVDNASTDTTPTMGRALANRGLLRYVSEPKLGLCHARNTGWRQARGCYVAYFDDDAIAEPGWIDAIAEAFTFQPESRSEPGLEPGSGPGRQLAIVGGRVLPMWEGERPAWLSHAIARSLTIVDWAPEPCLIRDLRVQWLVGANMVIRRDVLAEIGGFDPRLDRIGAAMLSGGDVYLQEAIIARGYACLYFPRMAIRHLAPRARLTKAWFEKRYYWQGISDAVMTLIRQRPTMVGRWRLAARAGRQLVTRPRDIASLVRRRSDDPRAFERRCHTLIAVGYIAGLLGQARV